MEQERTQLVRELYRVGELAQILNIHERTVYRWAEKGIIPAPLAKTRTRGGVNFWSKAHVDEWLKEQYAESKKIQTAVQAKDHRDADTKRLPLRIIWNQMSSERH